MNDSRPPSVPPIEAPERVDVAFPLLGERVPAEHGYGLFAAMCRLLGDLHGATWLAVHPIHGAASDDGTLRLRPNNLALRLRVDSAEVARVLPLTGAALNIEGHPVTVGPPRVFALEPVAALGARMVVIKHGGEREGFEAALHGKLTALGVCAEVEIPTRGAPLVGAHADGRRVLRIRQQTIVGYPVTLRALSAPDSLRLQALGVGSRQRFGCGVFSQVG